MTDNMSRRRGFQLTNPFLVCLILLTQFQAICGNIRGPSEVGPRGRDATIATDLLQEGKFKDSSERYRAAFVATRQERFDDLSRASRIAHTASIYFKDGKFAEAAALFQDAYQEMSKSTSVQIVSASAALGATLFSDCRDASLLAVRGTILLKQGDFHPSIETFKLAREKISNTITDMRATFDNCISAITIASVGKSVLMGGNFKESAEIFQRAYEKAKVDEVSLALLDLKIQSGLAWKGFLSIKQLRCFENASKSFQEAYEISHIPTFYFTFAKFRDASNMAKQGSNFLMNGQFSSALVEFKNALDKTDRDIFASYINATKSAIKGYDLLVEGKALEASEHFQNALLLRDYLFPGDVDALVNCRDTITIAAQGQALLGQRKLHEALLMFREAYNMSTVRELRYLFSRLRKLPYEGGSYCRHSDDIGDTEIKEDV